MKITGVVTILSHSCRPICRKWRDFCVLLRSKKRVGDKTTCQFTSVAFVYSELQISTIPWIFYRTFDPCEEFILSFFLFFEIFQKKKRKNIPNFTRLPRCKFLYGRILQVLRDSFIYLYTSVVNIYYLWEIFLRIA